MIAYKLLHLRHDGTLGSLFMWELIEALKDVDKEKICSTYIGEIIDRIFD